MTNTLHPIIAQYIAALNAFDTNGIVATFADDEVSSSCRTTLPLRMAKS